MTPAYSENCAISALLIPGLFPSFPGQHLSLSSIARLVCLLLYGSTARLSCGVDHNSLADRFDNLLPVYIGKNLPHINSAVRFRLSPAQRNILGTALHQLLNSYRVRLLYGTSPYSYPFRMYPPPRGFNRGIFNKQFMEDILDLGVRLRTKSKSKTSVQMNTFQLRAMSFAIRAHINFTRRFRHEQRRKSPEAKAALHIDKKSIAQLKAKSQRVIRFVERHMKRANRALMKGIGKQEYAALLVAWKDHLRWMRLHIAYCKPWAKPVVGLRARQQRDLDGLMQMAKRGLFNAGYRPPGDKELRHLMRLYARYARAGRQGNWTTTFLLDNKKMFSSKFHLAHFVIDRSKLSKLKELSKS